MVNLNILNYKIRDKNTAWLATSLAKHLYQVKYRLRSVGYTIIDMYIKEEAGRMICDEKPNKPVELGSDQWHARRLIRAMNKSNFEDIAISYSNITPSLNLYAYKNRRHQIAELVYEHPTERMADILTAKINRLSKLLNNIGGDDANEVVKEIKVLQVCGAFVKLCDKGVQILDKVMKVKVEELNSGLNMAQKKLSSEQYQKHRNEICNSLYSMERGFDMGFDALLAFSEN